MHRHARLRAARYVARDIDLNRRNSARRNVAWYLIGLFLLFVATIGAVLTAVVTIGAATAAALYHSFTEDLPSVSAVSTRETFKTTRILDRHGELLYELFDHSGGKRTVVPLNEMGPLMKEAILAAEDATFYENAGVEPRGIARALWQNLQAGEVVAGGSTITQQLIRNVLLDPEERNSESLNRKLKEAFLALELSANYSKDQILEWYLNEINFGNLSYGVGTAAKTYFNKHPRDLTLPEAALLAGLPQAPGQYDPFRNFNAAKNRQESILDLMAHHGFITVEESELAKQEPLQFVSPDTTLATLRYPHWVFYVQSVLEEWYGPQKLLTGGFTVYTTIDPYLQDIAEDSVRRQAPALARENATNAALVAIEPTTGEIIAMVGSPDYNDASIDGQVNAAVALRQPGSSIKPLVYLEGFRKGLSPGTVIVDEAISLPDGSGRMWRPMNFDNRFRGPVTLRRALGNSLNIPAVKVLQYAGLTDTINLAKRLGMRSLGDPSQYGLAFTLGGGEVRLVELAAAYSVLANGGVQVPVTPISKVVDHEGRVIYENKPVGQQVVDPRLVFMVTSILSDNSARRETFGLNSPLRLTHDRPAAAKTGTTDNYRDSWTMGYTPSLVTGVWVGRADNAPMRFVSGSMSAAQIWKGFMDRALADWPFEPFEAPPGMVVEQVCNAAGCNRDLLLEERSPSVTAKLAARSLAIDQISGRLADQETPFGDIVFRTFRSAVTGQGPFPPTEYSDRVGVSRPWEVLPATIVTTVQPGPTATFTPGPSPTATVPPTHTLVPTRPPEPPTPVPEPTRTPVDVPLAVQIRSPAMNQTVSGRVAVVGSAGSPGFQSYVLEYRQVSDGGRGVSVRRVQGSLPLYDDQLDAWDTTGVANGTYEIHLTVISATGARPQIYTVATVENP
jgi:1A family penicillin-binding protein